MKKQLYPGVEMVEELRQKPLAVDDTLPDFIDGKPNYDKYKNWSVEQTLAWLNID